MTSTNTTSPESLVKAGKSLAAPITAVAISIGLAILLAPVKFGPLFYVHNEPQVVVNPGALTGAAICFLVFPAFAWLMVRVGSDPARS